MNPYDVYNPLDYENLTNNLIRELMSRQSLSLPLETQFQGSGVYALFYSGDFPAYTPISGESKQPIYVGKADPPGGRKGTYDALTTKGNTLYTRICQHSKSIEQAANLDLGDFLCRLLVVEPLWIKMAEQFLIRRFKPVWNQAIDGFGNHDPGKGRHAGKTSLWDVLHPGRPWAEKLQLTRTPREALDCARAFFKEQTKGGDED